MERQEECITGQERDEFLKLAEFQGITEECLVARLIRRELRKNGLP